MTLRCTGDGAVFLTRGSRHRFECRFYVILQLPRNNKCLNVCIKTNARKRSPEGAMRHVIKVLWIYQPNTQNRTASSLTTIHMHPNLHFIYIDTSYMSH